MRSRTASVVPILALLAPAAPAAAAEPCKASLIGELPVTMEGMKPLVRAAINGSDELFVADSGAFYSMLMPAAAEQLHLRLQPAPGYLTGVGGTARVSMTTVKTFTIFKVDVHDVDFLVGGRDLFHGAAGILGQNVFRIGDVEYDLANRAIRILKPQGDCSKASLAYWANDKGLPYSQIDIDFATRMRPHTMASAYVNGVSIRVMFDTGADSSHLALDAAARAGVTPDSPGVKPGGDSRGIGAGVVHTWIAPVASFKIGDEEIRNTHLRIAERTGHYDMLIGADFFLSHRILVASSQHKLYFTYNGGPVFNLTTTPAPEPSATQAGPAGSAKSDE
jgi:hypothetical protein